MKFSPLVILAAAACLCGAVADCRAGENPLAPLQERILAGKELSATDVTGLTRWEARLLRNTVFARHGRDFESGQLSGFFHGQNWYRVDPSFRESMLTAVDRRNVTTLAAAGKDALRPQPVTPRDALRCLVDALASGDVEAIADLVHPERGLTFEQGDIERPGKLLSSGRWNRQRAARAKDFWLDDGGNGQAYSFRMSVIWSYPDGLIWRGDGLFSTPENTMQLEFAEDDGCWYLARIMETAP